MTHGMSATMKSKLDVENERLRGLLNKVLEEGYTAWAYESSWVDAGVLLCWSIPKELEKEIRKELSNGRKDT